MAAVADHDYFAAAARIFATSTCTLVTSGQVASNTRSPRASASPRHRLRDAMGAEDHRAARRDLASSSTNTAALALQVLDDVPVVHDLVADVDRRAVGSRGALDDADRALDTGAKTAWMASSTSMPVYLGLLRRAAERSPSRISSPAPTVIAESARLKAQKCQPKA